MAMSERLIVRYVGGPLDGEELDATGWDETQLRLGVYQLVEGWTDRAAYDPDPGGDPTLWRYRGPIPD